MPPKGANAFLGQIASLEQQGQVEALVEGMRAHKQSAAVQEQACYALGKLTFNNDDNTVRARTSSSSSFLGYQMEPPTQSKNFSPTNREGSLPEFKAGAACSVLRPGVNLECAHLS